MREEPFEVAVPGGVLHGHVAGDGPSALLLHGGAAVTDYMDGCARELAGLVRTIRYQQRGTYPSVADPPYTIEAHVADSIAVLDAHGLERAWVIGHSWGGHLALHVAVNHPERLRGVICVDPLGAFDDVFADQDAAIRRGLGADEIARIEEIEARRRQGVVTEEELLERFRLVWPGWFADRERAAPNPVMHYGAESSIEINRSLSEHYAAGTLVRKLPTLRLPMLFVHGELDALPVRSATETAALVRGARVELIPGCGHFPWLEQPGALRTRVERFLSETSRQER